jgi:hypothetical protein
MAPHNSEAINALLAARPILLCSALLYLFLAAEGLVLRQVLVQRPDQLQSVHLAQVCSRKPRKM